MMNIDHNAAKYAFSYLIEKEGNEIKITEDPKTARDAKKLLAALWKRIQGN